MIKITIACLIGVLWLGLTASPATASILRTADTSGAIVVQSRRTLRDQHHQSWQVIAFKRVQPMLESIALRLVGFPDSVEIAHPQPVLLLNVQGQVWTVADISDQIPGAQPSVGQYQIQSVLSDLATNQALRLEMLLTNGEIILLQIPPALIQEWQAIALTRPSQLINACDQFPLEARQNPAFPDWTGCRIAAEQ